MKYGKRRVNTAAKVNYPGFQRILDFTATGAESTKSVAVDGDTDKEYIVRISNSGSTANVFLQLNDDAGTNYGFQYIDNTSGTITAARNSSVYFGYCTTKSVGFFKILTPQGFIKTCFNTIDTYGTGTTMYEVYHAGWVYNSTANIIKMNFLSGGGNWDAGTRITVFARRSN